MIIVFLLKFTIGANALATISQPWHSTLQACIYNDPKLGTTLEALDQAFQRLKTSKKLDLCWKKLKAEVLYWIPQD